MSQKKAKSQPQSRKQDPFIWIAVLALLVGGVFANHYFASVAWALRASIGLLLSILVLSLVYQTGKGRAAWAFIKGSRTELRKVVWPTRQETIQTTMMVVAMVVVTALILWGIDALFFWLVSLLSK